MNRQKNPFSIKKEKYGWVNSKNESGTKILWRNAMTFLFF